MEKNKIPFFLFYLQIESNINLIKFQNINDEEISKKLNNKIQTIIKEKKSKNEKIGLNWLSLIGINIPEKYKNKFFLDVFDYIQRISNNSEYFKNNNKIKKKFIDFICEEIINLCFDFKNFDQNKILSLDYKNNNDEILSFLINSEKYLLDSIFLENCKNDLNYENEKLSEKEIKKYYSNINNDFNDILNKLDLNCLNNNNTISDFIFLLKSIIIKIIDSKDFRNLNEEEINKFLNITERLKNDCLNRKKITDEDEKNDKELLKMIEKFNNTYLIMEEILNLFKKNNSKFHYFITFPQEMKIINSKINFKLIKMQKILKEVPIIIQENNSIYCNLKNEYIYSPFPIYFYEDPIEFNIFSLSYSDVKISISNVFVEPSELFINLKSSTIKFGEFCKILLDFSKIKNIKELILNKKGEFIFKFTLNFKTSNNSKLNKNVKIKLISIPFSIDLICKNFELEKDFKLKGNFFSNEKLIFEIKNNQNFDDLNCIINIWSNKPQKLPKPNISEETKNKFIINIPETKDKNLLQCQCDIIFHEYFIIPLKIDSFIKPLEFDFNVFDYNSYNFSDKSDFILSKKFLKKNKKLEFDLKFQVNKIDEEKIFYGDFIINNENSEFIKIKEEKNVRISNKIYDLKMLIEFNENIEETKYSKKIILNINNVKKEVNINIFFKRHIISSYSKYNFKTQKFKYSRKQNLNIDKSYNNELIINYLDILTDTAKINFDTKTIEIYNKLNIKIISFNNILNIETINENYEFNNKNETYLFIIFENNNWFPLINIFEDNIFQDFEQIKLKNISSEQKKKMAKKLIQNLKNNDNSVNNYSLSFENIALKIIENQKIIEIINKFKEIIKELDGIDIFNFYEILNQKDNNLIKCLFIYRLYQWLKNKFNLLNDDNNDKIFINSILLKQEIEKEKENIFKKHYSFDLSFEKNLEIKEEFSYLYKFPFENTIYENNNDININENKQLFNENLEIFKKIKNIDVTNILEKNINSIKDIQNYYKNCIELMKIFPIYLIITLQNNQNDEKKIIDIYNQIFTIYKNSENDNSFIKKYVIQYRTNFEFLKNILYKSGLNNEQNKNSINNKNFPISNKINYKEKDWKSEKIFDEKDDKDDEDEDEALKNNNEYFVGGNNEKIQEEEDLNSKNKKCMEEVQNKLKEFEEEEEDKIKGKYFKRIENSENIQKEKIEKEKKEIEEKENKEKFLNIKNEEISRIINIIANFNSENKNYMSEIEYDDFYEYKEDYLDDYPIKDLYKKSEYLVVNFIKDISILSTEKNIPFNNICIDIVIDGGCYISYKNKIMNMLILCSLVRVFKYIEIDFSLSLITDRHFSINCKKYEDKMYEEKEILHALQIIYECLFCERYRTNYYNGLRFIKNKINNTKDKRIIIFLSDGISNQLNFPEEWNKKLFNDENIKFAFIFNLPDLNENTDDYKKVKDLWRNFQNNTKVTLVEIEKILDENDFNKFFNFLIFDNYQNNIENNNNINEEQELNLDFRNIFLKLNNYTQTEIYCENISLNFPQNNLSKNYSENKVIKEFKKIKVDKNIKNEFFLKNENLNNYLNEYIFPYNKGMRKELSSIGTELDIIAFIINSINPMPNPKIFLEEKDDLEKKYSVIMIIDNSFSCLNEITINHTINTIRVILSYLKIANLTSFSLIISNNGNPFVISKDINDNDFLDNLLNSLSFTYKKSSLKESIRKGYELINNETKNYMFILTDGLFDKEEQKNILNEVENCVFNNVEIIGIGIGVYPYGIKYLFPYIVYSPNPLNVMFGYSNFFGDNGISLKDEIPFINNNDKNFFSVINEYIHNLNNIKFPDLREKINKLILDKFDLHDIFEPEFNLDDIKEDPNDNPYIPLLKKNQLKGQKILILMLWSYDMLSTENKAIHKDYIKKGFKDNKYCIKTALIYFGIEIDIVDDYENAINYLKQTENGKCKYYSIWVICGPKKNRVLNDHSDQTLIGLFIKCLQEYWKEGGSIVFFADGNPHFYQVNKFLKETKFPDENGILKYVDFEIEGNDNGEQYLMRDESGELNRNGSFDVYDYKYDNKSIPSLGKNLKQLYEGKTISSAGKDKTKIKPFIPFAIDSSGNITILIFYGTKNFGDIIIDCGYSKIFLSINKEETFRYVQNLAAFPMFKYLNQKGEQQMINPKIINIQSIIDNYEANNEKEVYSPKIILIDIEIEKKQSEFNELKKDILDKYEIGDYVYFIYAEEFLRINDIQSLKQLKTVKFNKPERKYEDIEKEILKDFNENVNKMFVFYESKSIIKRRKFFEIFYNKYVINLIKKEMFTKLSNEECLEILKDINKNINENDIEQHYLKYSEALLSINCSKLKKYNEILNSLNIDENNEWYHSLLYISSFSYISESILPVG